MIKPNRTPATTAPVIATTPDPLTLDQTNIHMMAPQAVPNHAAVKAKLKPKLAKCGGGKGNPRRQSKR